MFIMLFLHHTHLYTNQLIYYNLIKQVMSGAIYMMGGAFHFKCYKILSALKLEFMVVANLWQPWGCNDLEFRLTGVNSTVALKLTQTVLSVSPSLLTNKIKQMNFLPARLSPYLHQFVWLYLPPPHLSPQDCTCCWNTCILPKHQIKIPHHHNAVFVFQTRFTTKWVHYVKVWEHFEEMESISWQALICGCYTCIVIGVLVV